MRLTNLRINPSVKDYIKSVMRHRLQVSDTDLLADVYSLVRFGEGVLLSDSKLDAETKRSAMARLLMKRRLATLRRLVRTDIFQKESKEADIKSRGTSKRAKRKAGPFLFATEKVLGAMQLLNAKIRTSQCLTCEFLSGCKFGQRTGQLLDDVSAVPSSLIKDDIAEECPARPEESLDGEMEAAINFLASLATEKGEATAMLSCQNTTSYMSIGDKQKGVAEAARAAKAAEMAQAISDAIEDAEDDAIVQSLEDPEREVPNIIRPTHIAGTGRADTTSYSRPNSLLNAAGSFLTELSASKLAVFQLARKLELLLDKDKKVSFQPVDEVTENTREETIRSIADASSVVPSQQALPDQVFDAKLARKQLIRNRHVQDKKRKQCLFILVDTSGSMRSAAMRFNSLVFTRSVLASCFSLALVRKTVADHGVLYYRTFSGGCSPLSVATTKADFDRIGDTITRCGYDGNFTMIENAIRTAAADISAGQAHHDIAKAEILLITDAGDSKLGMPGVVEGLRQVLGDTVLNVLDVSSLGECVDGSTALKKLADTYYSINGKATVLSDLVDLVASKTKKK